jgi:hypothetical protein
VQAGILDEREEAGLELRAAILADSLINERQKQVLLAVYDSFLKENEKEHGTSDSTNRVDSDS